MPTPAYPDYSQYIQPFIDPSSIGNFAPGVPTQGLNYTPGVMSNPGGQQSQQGGGFLDLLTGGLSSGNIGDILTGGLAGLFGGGHSNQYTGPQAYGQNGLWYSQFPNPSSPNALSRSPVNPVPITNIPGAAQSPTQDYGQLANSVRSLQDLLPYLGQATNQANLQGALGNLNIQNITAPALAQLQTQLFNTYGPQLNAIGNQINLRNALSAAQTANQVLTGPGQDLVKNAYNLSQVYDAPYYQSRQAASSGLNTLLGADVAALPGQLSDTERSEIGQGLARQNQLAGTAFAPSQIQTVANAEQYGQAGYARQQQAKSNLAQAINASAGFLPASKSGVDVFQVATGRPSMQNQGSNLFQGTNQIPTNLGDQASSQLFGQNANFANLNNQFAMNQANIDANKKDWMDMLSQITGSVSNLTSSAKGLAAICWVAREVYGANNPKWLLFRNWLLTKAPKWLRNLYIKYGESFAKFISNKPTLKTIIRLWMNSRIKIYVN